jgi:hypothetical protein
VDRHPQGVLRLIQIALMALCACELEQKIEPPIERVTALGESQNKVLFRLRPVLRRQVPLGFGQIQITLALPFFGVRCDPRSESDTEPEEPNDANHKPFGIDRL